MEKHLSHSLQKERENEKRETIQISKKTLFIGLIILIVAAILLYYNFSYLPEKNKEEEIKAYKKALYESILCQFTCALSPSKVQNTTVFLPDSLCQKICIVELRAKNINASKYSEQDVLTDNLAADIEKTMSDCKKLYTISQPTANVSSLNETSLAIPVNTTAYFPCVKQGLIDLQAKYPYIKDKEAEEDTASSNEGEEGKTPAISN